MSIDISDMPPPPSSAGGPAAGQYTAPAASSVDISDMPPPPSSAEQFTGPRAPSKDPYDPKYIKYQNLPSNAGMPKYTEQDLVGAKAGTDVDSGLPFSIKADPRLSFMSPLQRVKYIGDQLKKLYGNKFNPQTDLRGGVESSTGKLEYKIPGGRWTAFGNTSGEISEIGTMPAEAIRALFGTAGAFGGTAVGVGASALTGPAGEAGMYAMARTGGAVGGAAGNAGAEFVINALGREMGYDTPDPIGSAKDEFGNSLKWNALWEVGGSLKDIARWRIFGSNPFAGKAMETAISAIPRNREIIAAIQKEVPEFQPTAAQASGNNLLLALQQQIEAHPEFGKKLLALRDANENALGRYLDLAFTRAGGTGPESRAVQNLGGAQDTANEAAYRMNTDWQAGIDNAMDDYRAIASRYPQGSSELITAVSKLRDKLFQIRQAAKATKNAAFTARDNALIPMADDPVTLDHEFYQWMGGVNNEAGRVNYSTAANRLRSLLPDQLKEREAQTSEINVLDPTAPPGKAKAPEYYTTIGGIQANIDFLREMQKQASRGGTSNFTGKNSDIQAAIKAWTGLRDRALGTEEAGPARNNLLDLINKADEANVTYQAAANRSIMARMTNRDVGGFSKIADQTAIGSLIGKKDQMAYNQLVSAVKSDPEALQSLREAYMGLYSSKFTTNGAPDLVKHQKFMSLYGDQLKDLFGEEEWNAINRYGQIAETTTRLRGELLNMKDTFAKRYGHSLDDFNAESLVQSVENEEPQKFARTMAGVKELDGKMGTTVAQSMRTSYMNRLWSQAKSPSGVVDFSRIQKITSDPIINNIEQLYGPEFANDLKTVMGGMKTIRSIPGQEVGAPSQNTLISYISRFVWAPPLSREGRFLSFLTKFKADRYSQTLYDAMMDPEKMHELAQSSFKDIRSSAIGRALYQYLQPRSDVEMQVPSITRFKEAIQDSVNQR